MKTAIMLLMAAVGSFGAQFTEPPKYEVASIKPNTDNDADFTFHIGLDGSVTAAGITLKRLMMTGYNVQGFGSSGVPSG